MRARNLPSVPAVAEFSDFFHDKFLTRIMKSLVDVAGSGGKVIQQPELDPVYKTHVRGFFIKQ